MIQWIGCLIYPEAVNCYPFESFFLTLAGSHEPLNKKIQVENEHILEGLRLGDIRVIEHIFTTCKPSVMQLVVRQGGTLADGEDVFMDALEAIYRKLQSGGLSLDRAAFKTYLTQVCLYQWSRKARKLNRRPEVTKAIPGVQTGMEEIYEALADLDRKKIVDGKMQLLAEACRQLLHWFFKEEKSISEVAGLLGITEGNTRKRKYECKEKLFRLVKEDPFYHELKFPG